MYRPGAAGALLDIYEKAISDLQNVIKDIDNDYLTVITDAQTTDENCKSIQSVLSHVVHSGFGYAAGIHNVKGNNVTRLSKTFHLSISKYAEDLANVFAYTENIFKEIKDDELERFDNSSKIKTGWGQWYDIEQMMEHAIVHILRHTRQIERMKKQTIPN